MRLWVTIRFVSKKGHWLPHVDKVLKRGKILSVRPVRKLLQYQER